MTFLNLKEFLLFSYRRTIGLLLLLGVGACSGQSAFESSVSESPDAEEGNGNLVAVDILLPDNKTVVGSGVSLALSWTTNAEQPQSLKLFLSSDSGTEYTESVADITNSGSYTWTAPTTDGSTYKIRLVSAANSTLVVGNSPVFTVDGTAPTMGADQTVNAIVGVPLAFQLNAATDATAVTYEVVGSPSNGTLTGCTNGSSGNCIYTSTGGYVGQDSFTYRAVDSAGNVSTSTATVTVNVAVSGSTLLARSILASGGGVATQGSANAVTSIGLPKDNNLKDSGTQHITTTLPGILGN